MATKTRLGLVSAACAAGIVGLSGCERTIVAEPLEPAMLGPGNDAAMEFWHTLPAQSAVTNDEGMHGLLLLADGDDPATDYAQRLAALKERGWVEAGFDEPENMAMQRGTLAKALTHLLEIRGGVMMHVTDRAPRYAARELSYLGIIQPETTSNQVMSGLDYLAIVSRSQDYMTTSATQRQAAAAAAALREKLDQPENPAPADGSAPEPNGSPAPDQSQPAAPQDQPAGS